MFRPPASRHRSIGVAPNHTITLRNKVDLIFRRKKKKKKKKKRKKKKKKKRKKEYRKNHHFFKEN